MISIITKIESNMNIDFPLSVIFPYEVKPTLYNLTYEVSIKLPLYDY